MKTSSVAGLRIPPMRNRWGTSDAEPYTTVLHMTIRDDTDAEAALQYLIWALEEIERISNQHAAHHTRLALQELLKNGDRTAGETNKRPSRADN
jgi:hypothetical protein